MVKISISVGFFEQKTEEEEEDVVLPAEAKVRRREVDEIDLDVFAFTDAVTVRVDASASIEVHPSFGRVCHRRRHSPLFPPGDAPIGGNIRRFFPAPISTLRSVRPLRLQVSSSSGIVNRLPHSMGGIR